MDAYDPKRDLYVVLGVADDATAEDIKRMHRHKVKLVHPDGHRLPELATNETKTLNAAYEVLGDPARRLTYDAQRAAYRLRGQEAEIKRRVAEAMAQRPAPARAGDARATVKARADGVRAKVADVRATVRAKPSTVKAIALAKPAERTPGVFERLAQSKVEDFQRRNKPIDAAVWGVGSMLLDVWLGTTSTPATKTKRKPTKRKPKRKATKPARPRRR